MMKKLIVLYAGLKDGHYFDKVFDGLSAFEKSLFWANSIEETQNIAVFTDEFSAPFAQNFCAENKNIVSIHKNEWSVTDVLEQLSILCKQKNCDYAVFTFADFPFVNVEITEKMIKTHISSKAEYTFADGYPYGFSPEIIDAGALNILFELSKMQNLTEKSFGRTSIFDVMKGDINSFEIETEIADEDFRNLRFEFECSTKSGINLCKNLYDSSKNQKDEINLSKGNSFDLIELSRFAKNLAELHLNLPSFYNIQLTNKNFLKSVYSPFSKIFDFTSDKEIPFEQFKILIKKIADFSENATVSLSFFGEPFLHSQFVECVAEVLSHKNLSLFIETDGLFVNEETVKKLFDVAEKNHKIESVNFAVKIDAFSKEMYKKVNCVDEKYFEKAKEGLSILEKYFKNHVYAQFTRMKTNEDELESFFRFWNEKNSPSNGKLIIQKYDSFSGLLPDEKVADLSPLERIPCWHLKRDFCVLTDGSVILCTARFLEIQGNAFNEELSSIWNKRFDEVKNHLCKNYCQKCENCDEFYTFNF